METKKVEKERSAMQLMIDWLKDYGNTFIPFSGEKQALGNAIEKAIELQANEEREMIIDAHYAVWESQPIKNKKYMRNKSIDYYNNKYGSDE